jgi:hypothetical protein
MHRLHILLHDDLKIKILLQLFARTLADDPHAMLYILSIYTSYVTST